MRLNLFVFSIALVLLFNSSCNTRPAESTEPSEGMPGEVFVVSDEDQIESIEQAFKSHNRVCDSNLIVAEHADEKQYEKLYAWWFGRSQSFEGSEKKASLIVIFGDAGKYSSYLTKLFPVESVNSKNGFSMQVFRNVWANPQTVIRIRYGRDMNAEKILSSGGDKELNSLLYKYEIMQGLPGNLASNAYCDSVSKVIQNNYGFHFSFPPQFRLVYSNSDVVWLEQETSKFYRHLFINIFSDNTPLDSLNQLVANRNEFTIKYLKNTEGTQTLVSRSSAFPASKSLLNLGKTGNATVLKGWYQEEATFRRGPFVRYIFHDKAQHRYIAFDGFVYAPDLERRPFYRLFEIMAQSFTLK